MVWVVYVCCEGGAGYIWWPWWIWGVCKLLVGCVCAMRKVQATCGVHGVRVDYLWAVYVL